MPPRIIALGAYHPGHCVSNHSLAPLVGLDDRGIFKRTGIRTRYWAEKDQASSDLGAAAARQALERAGIPPEQIDLIVVSTTSPDMFFPSTACLIQRQLGARRAAAFDVAASCAGFLTALDVGRQFLLSGQFKYALVIAAEVKSRFLDLKDTGTAILFGDGAGAAVLAADSGPAGILGLRLGADGSRSRWIELPAGGSRRPTTAETVAEGLHTMRMNGTALFRAAVRRLDGAIREIRDDCGLAPEAVAHYVLHQANGRILAALARTLSLKPEQLILTLPDLGNTSSASLPMALERLVASGAVTSGQHLILAAFGGGLNWGAAAVRW